VPISAPSCRTTTSDGHPAFDDGPPRTLVDRDGLTRHACAFRVPAASRRSLRPLVVFFHGLGGSAATVYNATLLRQKAETFVLSGEATRPGFHLLSVQGRNLGFPGGALGDGAGFDFFHRALAQPSSNADIDFVDRLIDERVAEGDVDPSQLYVVGWSSGGYFAQLYAIARATTPTAGGPPRRRRVRVLGRGSLRAA
jgi:poly(3-hydroxybutyrate) depolymerase